MLSLRCVRTAVCCVIFTLAAGGLRAQQPSPLLRILEQEIGRNFGVLKEKADPPPYFLSYTVVESEGNVIAATMGAVSRADERPPPRGSRMPYFWK